MPRRYQAKTPPDESKSKCYPSRRIEACLICTRWRIAEPPADRQNVVIDASVTIQDGVCFMFIARPVERAYAEIDL